MAEAVEIRLVHNVPEFKRQLNAFALKFQRQIVGSAASAAAKVFKKAVIAEAPQRTGTLKRAIYMFRSRKQVPGEVRYTVSFRKGRKEQAVTVRRRRKGVISTEVINRDAFYGRFLEVGWIPRGPARKFGGGERTRRLKRERALAAGVKRIRRPFIAPAARKAESAALQAFNAKMQQGLDKANREKT